MGPLKSKAPKAVAPPPIIPPAPMADPDDPLAKQNARRDAAQKFAQVGKQQTLLSQFGGSGDTLG